MIILPLKCVLTSRREVVEVCSRRSVLCDSCNAAT